LHSAVAENGAGGHFLPLHCTFLHCTRKTTPAKGHPITICNEIKDLAAKAHPFPAKKTLPAKHLAAAMEVVCEPLAGLAGLHHVMCRYKSSPCLKEATRASTYAAASATVWPDWPAAPKLTSSSSRTITVARRRAPMFSVRSFTSQ